MIFPRNGSTDRGTDRERAVRQTAAGGIVVDGLERAWVAIEAEVRPEVEEAYSQEWNAAGLFKRWRMQRRIEQEIALRVGKRLSHVSDLSVF